MSRSLVIGNGNALVNYDSHYVVRDVYWPHVGATNQTLGNPCRTGFWVDNQFSWVGDQGWECELGYEDGALVTQANLTNRELGLAVHFRDCIDMTRDWYIRCMTVTPAREVGEIRVYFHYDWYIGGSDIGNTVLYDPRHRCLVAYKDQHYFLAGGQAGADFGLNSWATGKKGSGQEGTWIDAEDGELGRNPIEQGAVDCVAQLNLAAAGSGVDRTLTHWLCMGPDLRGVTHFGQDLILERGVDVYAGRTQRYWQLWSDKGRERHVLIDRELGGEAHALFRESALIARAHCDNKGGVIAATDFDITKFARDTYNYVWPRDGALVVNALDRAGYEESARHFFNFCRSALTPEGFLLHKYTAAGDPGSSWHPWVDARGQRMLPIQEDETGLVLWALWEHFRIHRNLDFAVDLYGTLVVPAARWMASYVDGRTQLPLSSWDLWEERWGLHAFTVGAAWAGLEAAARFGELFGDGELKGLARSAANNLKAAADAHLFRPELGRFARRLVVEEDGSLSADPVIDSAIYGLWRFGMYAPNDERIRATMLAIQDQLTNRAEAGGMARYSNDYYFQVEHDLARTPGNPWFICSMWMAQWIILTAESMDELKAARAVIGWVTDHKQAGGLLSEQLDPHSGAPLSVSPLTWSQAEFMVTVDDYLRRQQWLRSRPQGTK
ncbi:MAG TPA: glycoside hydrolase family 15 protein [Candidatus Acidoferrales bacterium]|nr:glycoside hydrolase family 15 protein [Candidatus Acidoferrales bacterium]